MVNIQMPRDAILLPREQCRFYLLTFPGLTQKEAAAALEFRLPEVYPGSLDAVALDFRLLKYKGRKDRGKKGETSILALVVEKKFLNDFLKNHPEKRPYVPLFHLLDAATFKPGDSVSISCSCSSQDSSAIRDTLSCSRGGTWEYSRENISQPHPGMADWNSTPPPSGKVIKQGYRGVFSSHCNPGKRHSLPVLMHISLILLALLTAGALYGTRLTASMEQLSRELSRSIGLRSEQANRRTVLTETIEKLEAELALRQRKPGTDPWICLASLAPIMPQQTVIQSFSSRDNIFSLELTGPDALKLAGMLKEDDRFFEIELQEIRVSGPGEKPRYRISCRFSPGNPEE